MEILLLIISDWNLRQLYHELLFSKNIEVVPIDSVENSILILTLNQIGIAIFYVDNKNISEFEIFLSLRQRHRNLAKTKVVVLTSFTDFRFSDFSENDLVLNIDSLTPVEITDKIKELF